jgi:hypothetical protein
VACSVDRETVVQNSPRSAAVCGAMQSPRDGKQCTRIRKRENRNSSEHAPEAQDGGRPSSQFAG